MTDKQKTQSTEAASSPGPQPYPAPNNQSLPHNGVTVSGDNGADSRKAFYIHIDAIPGKENDVIDMLKDILTCVEDEPATCPWYAVRYSQTTFGIFEVFPNIAGRQAHVEGGGGDIFRDVQRMNKLLAYPAHVYKVDVLMSKEVFAKS